MTLDALIMFFYLLFLPFNMSVQQRDLLRCADKNITAEEREFTFKQVDDFLGGMKAESSTNYSDSFSIGLDESLLNPKYGPQSEGASIANDLWEENFAEVQYINSLNKIHLFEYGEEKFEKTRLPDGRESVISVNALNVTRTTFDDDFRVKQKLTWRNGISSGSMYIVRSVNYYYGKRTSAVPYYVADNDYKNKNLVETYLDYRGNPTEINYYDTSEKNRRPMKKSNFAYDSANRVISEEEILFISSDDMKSGTRKTENVERKNVYTYTKKSSKPDLRFYENGVLRMETHYSAENDYEDSVYFSEGFVLKSLYKDNSCVEEITYINGVEAYRRGFDEN